MPERAVASRRAALLAHAMPAADREWLLAELDEGRRGVLAALLDDLRSLGIPRDPGLVRQLLDEEAAGDPGRSLAALHSAGVAKLLEVLRGEPESVVGPFLRARAWPWRDAVLHELGAHAQRAFALQGAAVPRRLEQALVSAVWTAVEARSAGAPQLRKPSLWTRFRFRRTRA
jgi:hypothetical protein